jgi:hypothetical protein
MNKVKKTRRVRAAIMSALLCASAMAGTVAPVATSSIHAATVKISATKATIGVKTTKQLKITGSSAKVTWKSSNTSVVKVSSSGKITGVKKGTATVTATVGQTKVTCKVTVENPKINKTAVSTSVGKKVKLKISGTTQNVKWSSSDTCVATVSSSGVVTAKHPGTVTIKAKIGNVVKTCEISVTNANCAHTTCELTSCGHTTETHHDCTHTTVHANPCTTPTNSCNSTVIVKPTNTCQNPVHTASCAPIAPTTPAASGVTDPVVPDNTDSTLTDASTAYAIKYVTAGSSYTYTVPANSQIKLTGDATVSYDLNGTTLTVYPVSGSKATLTATSGTDKVVFDLRLVASNTFTGPTSTSSTTTLVPNGSIVLDDIVTGAVITQLDNNGVVSMTNTGNQLTITGIRAGTARISVLSGFKETVLDIVVK